MKSIGLYIYILQKLDMWVDLLLFNRSISHNCVIHVLFSFVPFTPFPRLTLFSPFSFVPFIYFSPSTHSVPLQFHFVLFRTVPLPHEFKHSFDMYRFICPTVSWLRSVFSPFYKASLSDIRFLFSGTPRSIVFSVPFHPVSCSVLFRFVQFPPVLFTRTPYWNYF